MAALNDGEGVEKLIHFWWGYKIKHATAFHLSNFTPEHLSQRNEDLGYVHTKTYTRMFLAALFVIAPDWKQPSCLLTGEWVNKL